MKTPNDIERAALAITRWVGSLNSIIAHTIFFAVSFWLAWAAIVAWETMLLVLTTLVSLEAIYLAIFIQMTINFQSKAIASVEEDIDEIQEDVGEIQEDVGEIQEDVEEMSQDLDELHENVEDISEDIAEEESAEEAERRRKAEQQQVLATIQENVKQLLADIERLKQK